VTDRVEALQRSPLFAALGRRELKRIAAAMSSREFPAGTAIATEGEIGVGFFIVDEGSARVSSRGREVGQLGPGDHFGEIALIVEAPRTATVTARTDLRCYGMTSWDFRRLVEGNATVAWQVMEAMAHRLLELGADRAEVQTHPVERPGAGGSRRT
jgi:CRP-like cAMP-binding protein